MEGAANQDYGNDSEDGEDKKSDCCFLGAVNFEWCELIDVGDVYLADGFELFDISVGWATRCVDLHKHIPNWTWFVIWIAFYLGWIFIDIIDANKICAHSNDTARF